MNPQERIRQLRKSHLHLTQSEFAEKLHMSRSNFSNIENQNVDLTERVINDICREFDVNRDWLMNGNEPIFHPDSKNINRKIAQSYEMLNEDNQKYVQGYIQRLLDKQNAPTAAFADNNGLTDDEVSLLKQMLEKRRK